MYGLRYPKWKTGTWYLRDFGSEFCRVSRQRRVCVQRQLQEQQTRRQEVILYWERMIVMRRTDSQVAQVDRRGSASALKGIVGDKLPVPLIVRSTGVPAGAPRCAVGHGSFI